MIIVVMNRNQNELAKSPRHEGIRVGEIIACRAWRVIEPGWWWEGDDRLHSVLTRSYGSQHMELLRLIGTLIEKRSVGRADA